jgi:hypothetical protein
VFILAISFAGALRAIAAEMKRENYGSPYLQSIDSELFAKRDFWYAYKTLIPSKRHRAFGKETGKTNDLERFNCTLRPRVSRLVRKTRSFSKKIENQIGAIWYFIHYYIDNGSSKQRKLLN